MLLGGHHEVVSVIFVVDNVLQSDTEFIVKIIEEVLFIDECHTADLVHNGLGCGPLVGEVCSDGDGQLTTELLPPETRNCDMFSLGTNQDIHSAAGDWMVLRCAGYPPERVLTFRFDDAVKADATKDLNTEHKSSLEQDTL